MANNLRCLSLILNNKTHTYIYMDMYLIITFIGSISMVAIYKSKWKSAMDSRNCKGVNCLRYLDNESKS